MTVLPQRIFLFAVFLIGLQAVISKSFGADSSGTEPAVGKVGAGAGKSVLSVRQRISQLDLPGLLEYAKKHNPLYRAAEQDVKIAEADLVTAGLLPNPVFTYQHQFIGGTRGSEGGEAERAPGFLMDVDFFGKLWKRKEVARLGVQTANVAYKDFDRLFCSSFRKTYYRHLYLTEEMRFKKQFFDTYEQLFHSAEIRANAGDMPKLELDRLELERIGFEAGYRAAEAALKQTSKDLLRMLGVSDYQLPLDLRERLKFKSLKDLGVRTDGGNVDERPDLVVLKYQAKGFHALAGLKAREAYPKINLGGEYRFKGWNEGYAGFFLMVPLPVFDRNQGLIERAEQSQVRTEMQAKAKKLEIKGEMETALAEVLQREALLLDYERRRLLAKNESVAERSQTAYLQKASTLVAFLESQRNYLNVLQSYHEQVYLYYLALNAFQTASYAANSST